MQHLLDSTFLFCLVFFVNCVYWMMLHYETLKQCRILGKVRVYISERVWGISVMSHPHGCGHRLHLHNKIWRCFVLLPSGDEPPAWRSFQKRVCVLERERLVLLWCGSLMMHISYARTLNHVECLILCNEPHHCALLKNHSTRWAVMMERISTSFNDI